MGQKPTQGRYWAGKLGKKCFGNDGNMKLAKANCTTLQCNFVPTLGEI